MICWPFLVFARCNMFWDGFSPAESAGHFCYLLFFGRDSTMLLVTQSGTHGSLLLIGRGPHHHPSDLETCITTTQQGELQILNYHAPGWPRPRRPFGCRDDGCPIALYKSTMLRTRESAGRRPRKEPPPYLRLGKSAVSGDPHAPLPQWPKRPLWTLRFT